MNRHLPIFVIVFGGAMAGSFAATLVNPSFEADLPEPSTIALLAMATLLVGQRRRRS